MYVIDKCCTSAVFPNRQLVVWLSGRLMWRQ